MSFLSFPISFAIFYVTYTLHGTRYEENEAMWAKIKAEILGESDSDEDGEDEDEDDDSDDQEEDAQGKPHSQMTQQVRGYVRDCSLYGNRTSSNIMWMKFIWSQWENGGTNIVPFCFRLSGITSYIFMFSHFVAS